MMSSNYRHIRSSTATRARYELVMTVCCREPFTTPRRQAGTSEVAAAGGGLTRPGADTSTQSEQAARLTAYYTWSLSLTRALYSTAVLMLPPNPGCPFPTPDAD